MAYDGMRDEYTYANNKKLRVSKSGYESEEGILLPVNRSIQVEGAFGVTKEDRHFRRFFTHGKARVSRELFLLCFGYNVNKLHHKIQQGRYGRPLATPVKTQSRVKQAD
jgi:hypothetical protein